MLIEGSYWFLCMSAQCQMGKELFNENGLQDNVFKTRFIKEKNKKTNLWAIK